jgi:glutathione S-transferase
VITDATRTIAETGAIVDYLIGEYGAGRLIPPQGSEERLRYTYWLHFAEGSAMPPLVMTLLFGELPKRMPVLIRPVGRMIGNAVRKSYLGPNIAAQQAFMEATLERGAWFAGSEFTAADVMMSFPVEAAAARGGLGGHRLLAGWLERIHARPAYQAALRQGGPYAYA